MIAGDLSSFRTRAIATRADQSLTVSTIGEGVIVDSTGARLPLPPSARISLVTAGTEKLAEDTGRIVFFADGSSTGGGIRIETDGKLVTIAVEWLTGSVRVEETRP